MSSQTATAGDPRNIDASCPIQEKYAPRNPCVYQDLSYRGSLHCPPPSASTKVSFWPCFSARRTVRTTLSAPQGENAHTRVMLLGGNWAKKASASASDTGWP